MAKQNGNERQTERTESTVQQIRRDSTAPETVDLGRVGEVDVERERRMLEESYEAQAEEAARGVDRRVEEETLALQRAEEEAQPLFQAERDRIAAEEQRSLDNQALYAEMRGDRGGIGQAQSASIRNTAALNRAQVEREQRSLATQTAQKIADLRRQGEYDKADALLKLTQQKLAELTALERWAKETNLDIEKFNTQLARWEAEYAWEAKKYGVETELSVARLTGEFGDGTPTFEARQAERARLAEAAKQLLAVGLTLTPEQLEALGWSEGQYAQYIAARGGGSGRGSSGADGKRSRKAARKTFFSKKGKEQTADRVDEMLQAEPGKGAPFQLVASWIETLQQGEDPYGSFEKMEESPYFEQMSDRQRRWVAEAFREAAGNS